MSLSRRRVRRVIRRIEPWSVLRFSIVFYACLLVILIVAGAALWIVASIVGVVHNAEKFIGELFLLDNFRFLPFQILRATAIAGTILVVLGTAANVLLAVLYNLISDVIGGIEIVSVEEDQTTRTVV